MVHQRDESSRRKSLTFMIVPHNSARSIIKINLPLWAGITLGILFAALIISFIGAFAYSAKITGRLIKYYSLKAENKRQQEQIKIFIDKTKELEKGVRELEERDQELREMLGLGKKRSAKEDNTLQFADEGLPKVISFLDSLITRIENKKTEYKTLKELTVAAKYKYDSLPSIWPINGEILSGFGMRRHPFTGKWQMHNGIDIPTWEGAPVRAAANGKVIYADWSNGYGQAVAIDHYNGFSTIYGHNERILVQYGDKVYKGQIIALAGSTGLATGTHVHYEVQKNGHAINPVKYLDLNIRTARLY